MSLLSFETGNIYNGDCLDIIKKWPDNCVDLVITDPPYGMNYHSNHYKDGNVHKPILGDDCFPIDTIKECFRIARCAVLSFCRWNNLKDIPPPKSFIVWAKNNWTAGDLEHEYGRSWEGIAFWPMEGHQFNLKRPSDLYDFRKIPSSSLNHPTEKPISIMSRLIDANVGDIILDPYCGSGSTLVAAERLGRKWVGIEIDKDYCAVAERRISDERSQLRMFP